MPDGAWVGESAALLEVAGWLCCAAAARKRCCLQSRACGLHPSCTACACC